MNPQPPQLALRFLRWYCRVDYLEEIEGNLIELYESQHAQSAGHAKQQFIWNVLRHFRPAFIRSLRIQYPTNFRAMFRHNLLLSFRNFQRYKSSFIINLTGLSTGLACAMMIYLWVSDELRMDKFHEHDRRLYQLMEHRLESDIDFTTWTSALTAPTLVEEMPEVEYAVACFNLDQYTLSVDDRDLQATGQFVDKDFFRMFTYPLIQGDPARVLTDQSSIVISESLAEKLFNTSENAVGKTIEWEHDAQVQISGVFEDVPRHSTTQFDFVLSFDIYREQSGWANRWQTSWPLTYALLKPGADVNKLNEKLADLIERKTNREETHRILFAAPYSDTYLFGEYENRQQAGGRIEYVRLFSVIAIFIVLIACINFMNLSTANASRRLKEVGVKKAIGAGRSALIVQYLGESTLMALFSLIIAVGLVLVFLPQFNQVTGKQLSSPWDATLILTFISITLIAGLMAGSYPAIYLSGFNPVKVLRGKLDKSVGEVWARRGLVVMQFTLSIIMMVSVFVVYRQVEYVQNKHLGYEKDNVLYFSRRDWTEGHLETLLAEIRKLSGVIRTSSTGHDMTGHIGNTDGVDWSGKDPADKSTFEMMPVNYELLELLDFEMESGRKFSRDFSTDTAGVIFNEAAITQMGLSDPIGGRVKLWGEEREIIGVVRDFSYESLHEQVKPVIMWISPPRTRFIAVKVAAGRESEVIAQLQPLVDRFYPGFPFDYHFLDQEYQQQYQSERRVSTLSRYFAGLAIFISCLGLLGLSAFTAERRLKELGIRKVLGASMISIITLFSADFTKMVLVSILIAIPISYFTAQRWLQNFAFAVDLDWWYFAGAGLLALVIAWLSVGYQTLRAARVNPVECLRDE